MGEWMSGRERKGKREKNGVNELESAVGRQSFAGLDGRALNFGFRKEAKNVNFVQRRNCFPRVYDLINGKKQNTREKQQNVFDCFVKTADEKITKFRRLIKC